MIDMMQFQNMLDDRGIQYTSIFDLELKDTIFKSTTTVSSTLTTLFHHIKTTREWNEDERQYVIDFFEEQYINRTWSYRTAAGVFYVGTPAFISV